MNTFDLKVTNEAGQEITVYTMCMLDSAFKPVLFENQPICGPRTDPEIKSANDALYYTIKADGYKDKTVTLVPGANVVKLEKLSVAGAVAQSATNNWKWILLAIVLLILAWIGYKKFIAKKPVAV